VADEPPLGLWGSCADSCEAADAPCPPAPDVHLVCYNLANHETAAISDRLTRDPASNSHFMFR
jgi:hypothetical protein